MYFIHEGKLRAPTAAAMALIERLNDNAAAKPKSGKTQTASERLFTIGYEQTPPKAVLDELQERQA